MDTEQSPFCHIHAAGETVKQSLDKSELPQIQQFIPTGMMAVSVWLDDASEFSFLSPIEATSLARSTSPPVSILHCCFRI